MNHDPIPKLDAIALAASQRSNSGNWFYSYRRAMEGVASRMWGANEHFLSLTQWKPLKALRYHEYELASCLFCVDSAIECWVFAMNSLGYGVSQSEFEDMTDARALKRINPELVLNPSARQVRGFAMKFPLMTAHWKNNEDDIRLIMSSHDVSKHRSATFSGGTIQLDPPEDVRTLLGLSAGQNPSAWAAPMSEVLLPLDPKLPLSQRPSDLAHWFDFTELRARFDLFMAETASLSLDDARGLVP